VKKFPPTKAPLIDLLSINDHTQYVYENQGGLCHNLTISGLCLEHSLGITIS